MRRARLTPRRGGAPGPARTASRRIASHRIASPLECCIVTGTLSALFVAMLAFVGGHVLLSWPPVRSRLVAVLGERPFLVGYALVSALFLAWAIMAYRVAPFVGIWEFGPAGRALAAALMPIALILAVIGLTTPNPTAVGGERFRDANRAARGIVTITRHPFLWGTALWSVAHLAANGDAAAALLFGGLLILSLGGMAAIDHKRALRLGDDWKAFAARTSLVPFAAVAAGRVKVDWRGIGWWRPGLAIVLYAILLFSHGWLFGVPVAAGR
jgi:uncharacterized membrane protein